MDDILILMNLLNPAFLM